MQLYVNYYFFHVEQQKINDKKKVIQSVRYGRGLKSQSVDQYSVSHQQKRQTTVNLRYTSKVLLFFPEGKDALNATEPEGIFVLSSGCIAFFFR